VAMATDEMRACQRCQLHLSSIRKAVWCRNISACVIRSSMKWKYAYWPVTCICHTVRECAAKPNKR
jgi:hypothetical protein